MGFYDPAQNTRRVREGLAAAVKGHASNFEDARDQLALIFNGRAGVGSRSRILTVQDFLAENLTVKPSVGAIRPGCITVTFAFPGANNKFRAELYDFIERKDFQELCIDVGVTQVLYGTKTKQFPVLDYSTDLKGIGRPEPA